MKDMQHYYAGVGLAVGTGLGAAVWMTVFAITGNPVFIAFTGTGTAFGLIIGAGIDAKNKKTD
jgi:hypothetical protein